MPHPGSFTTFAATGSPSGPAIDTGAWFVVGVAGQYGASGEVTKLVSLADYEHLQGPREEENAVIHDSLELFFRSGGAVAYLTTVDAGASFVADAATALTLFPASLGPGQMSVPGAVDTATQANVIASCEATNRTAILDGPDVAAPALLTAAAAIATLAPDQRAGLFAGWPILPALPGGTVRIVPPCGGVAGRINAVDGRLGHAAGAAAGDQGWGAGRLDAAIGVSRTYTDDQWDELTAAGVNLLVPNPNGRVEIYGWRTGSADPVWTFLNYQRLRMQIVAGGKATGRPFVFRLIDGPRLFAEFRAALDGYMVGLYERGAFYGATAEIAFEVDTIGPNTPEVTAAGELKANVSYIPAGLAERVTTQISMSTQEAAA
jgi:phage tail sheath protein FI